MSFFLHGVKIPHRKNTSDQSATHMTNIKTVSIPMVMHIGAPATPIVKVGDYVQVGTKIAEAVGFISAPIHASISGTVTKIADVLISAGKMVPANLIYYFQG